MVSPFRINPSSPAPVVSTWLSSHARRECFALKFFEWHFIFDWMWGFDFVGPPVPAHISLTVSTRFAHWTGVYMRGLVALFLIGSFTIMLIMCVAMRDLPHAHH